MKLDPRAQCPLCFHGANGATSLTDNARPAAGDISICIECATVLVFEATPEGFLTVRIARDTELDDLPLEQRRLMAAGIDAIIRRRE